MSPEALVELVGYAASVLIAVSLMMTSIVRLRVINLAGAACFSLYGHLIGSLPVTLLNGFIVAVNLFFLLATLRSRDFLRVLAIKPDSDLLRHFLDFHRDRIDKILPGFRHDPSRDPFALFLLRNCQPVAAVLGRVLPDGTLHIALDYAIPNYRDIRMGRFLFVEQASFFRERGVTGIAVRPRTKDYAPFLRKVGFHSRGEELYFPIPATGVSG
jgi:hypothetical protein